MGVRHLGLEPDLARQYLDGLGRLAALAEHEAEVIPAVRVVGPDGDGRAQLGDGLIRLAVVGETKSPGTCGRRSHSAGRDHLAEVRDRVSRVPLHVEDHSEVEEGVGILGLGFDHQLEGGECQFHPPVL